MSISPELQCALDKTRVSFDHVCSDMARNLVTEIYRIRTINQAEGVQEQFPITLRKALNECDVRENREAYSTFAGYYFGARGINAQRSSLIKPKLPERTASEVEVEPSGQVALVL